MSDAVLSSNISTVNGHDRAEWLTGPSAPSYDSAALPPLEPKVYINRELSWLEFNRRVLDEVSEKRTPLLERVKFAAIFSSNLDEFFMIRVAGVKRKVITGIGEPGADGRTPSEQLRAIQRLTQGLLSQQAAIFANELIPSLVKKKLTIVPYARLAPAEQHALGSVFEREIFPVLTPQAVDRGRRFPHISNDSLNLCVVLKSKAGPLFARVKVPALLPRLVPVPSSKPHAKSGTVLAQENVAAATERFTWLEEIIAAHLDRLFPGSEVVASYPFHLLRDSDVEPDEDDDDHDDLMEIMRETLAHRPFGMVVRIDIDRTMPEEVCDWLLEQVHGNRSDLYVVDGHLHLKDLWELTRIERPDLKDQVFIPASLGPWSKEPAAENGEGGADIFAILRRRDMLVHHPYQSFNAIVEFLRAASRDTDVVAIKQTLYRIGKDSPLIPALIDARDDDTQVAVLVELKARFDEENNISWAQTLEKHGVHVAYGLMGLKTHCKLTLVVRREPDGLRRYVHIATGNYNAVTARIYEDIGLLTSREDIASDVSELFNVLTGYARQGEYRSLIVAPSEMRSRIIGLILREIAAHKKSGKGHLIFKMNSLVDKETIRALYAASRAGVRVDLIIRGICCLRPGLSGWSDNIRVVSVVGRFLEHSRVYWFHNGGESDVYIGSADAMERNFDRRVEVLVPVQDATLRAHLREVILPAYLRDTVNARQLNADGTWEPVKPDNNTPPFDVQTWLMQLYRTGPVGGPLW